MILQHCCYLMAVIQLYPSVLQNWLSQPNVLLSFLPTGVHVPSLQLVWLSFFFLFFPGMRICLACFGLYHMDIQYFHTTTPFCGSSFSWNIQVLSAALLFWLALLFPQQAKSPSDSLGVFPVASISFYPFGLVPFLRDLLQEQPLVLQLPQLASGSPDICITFCWRTAQLSPALLSSKWLFKSLLFCSPLCYTGN